MTTPTDPAFAWRPPRAAPRITSIDLHTAGEPFRVVTSGLPEIPGDTMLAKRRWATEHLDGMRRTLMLEPRGHADMYGAFVTPPVSDDSDLGVLFIHNQGFSTMCGHGIIALATLAVETKMVGAESPQTRLGIDTPAGPVTARVQVDDGHAGRVVFRNVPSFAVALDRHVEVDGFGRVPYDLAFGGAFYAYIAAEAVGLECSPAHLPRAVTAANAIKHAITDAHPIEHPFEDDLGFLYGVVFTAAPRQRNAHSRNLCVFADGEVDRSPTGTSVSARLAVHHARGEIAAGERIVIESVLGTTFGGSVAGTTKFGPYDAVIPEIDGRAWITGRHEFLIHPADPLGKGFLLR